ncbi:hypothetical protein Q604_UNBC16741G0001, partial [human gut metagenome]
MLNDVASRIWTIIEDDICIKDVINLLLKEYDINEETCTKSVLEFCILLNCWNMKLLLTFKIITYIRTISFVIGHISKYFWMSYRMITYRT